MSLAVEASEGLTELYWQGIESTAALAEVADLPDESADRRRHSLDVDRAAKKPTPSHTHPL